MFWQVPCHASCLNKNILRAKRSSYTGMRRSPLAHGWPFEAVCLTRCLLPESYQDYWAYKMSEEPLSQMAALYLLPLLTDFSATKLKGDIQDLLQMKFSCCYRASICMKWFWININKLTNNFHKTESNSSSNKLVHLNFCSLPSLLIQ